MITTVDIERAARRIGPHVRATPLMASEPLSDRLGANLFIKPEHTQLTGSFKLRGALNKVLGLSEEVRRAGVVTASSGNHGIATATASKIAGIACTVYLPTGASAAKVDAIARLGAEIVTIDSTDAFQAELLALSEAEHSGRAYVSPYNDPDVIAGQGTVGLELLADATGDEAASRPGVVDGSIDAVVVAVGGGGLISGVATWLADRAPDAAVVGASPANDAAMVAAVAAGSIVDIEAEPTYSDGTAGGIEDGAITFPVCQNLVAEWITVGEAEIAASVTAMIDDHHQLVEGAAGVALAAAGTYAADHQGANIVVVTCGANISSSTLASILTV